MLNSHLITCLKHNLVKFGKKETPQIIHIANQLITMYHSFSLILKDEQNSSWFGNYTYEQIRFFHETERCFDESERCFDEMQRRSGAFQSISSTIQQRCFQHMLGYGHLQMFADY